MNVVEDEVMILKIFFEKRIRENIKMFSIEELEKLKNNKNTFLKIYLLGIIDNYNF